MFKRLIITLSCLPLAACSALLSKKQVDAPQLFIAPKQAVTLPTPQQLGLNIKATQLLSARYRINGQSQSKTAQVELEANPQRIVMVALAPWGGSLFSLRYDGRQIHSSSLPMPNASLGVKHVLLDFVLTYASPTVIQTMLKGTNVHARFAPHLREFVLKGQPIVTIRYQYRNPWQGQIVLNNRWLHYTITIQTLSQQA